MIEDRRPPPSFFPLLARIALGAVGFTLLFALLGLALPTRMVRELSAESGPLELASALGWTVLALAIPVFFQWSRYSVAGAALAAGAAAREADWHKRFTEDSVLKPTFYLRAEYPIQEQIIGGAIVALLIISLAMLTGRFFRHASRDPRFMPPWAAAGFAALAITGASKLLDRLPDILDKSIGVEMAESQLRMMRILEEGLELGLPALFAVASASFYFDRFTVKNPAASPQTQANSGR